MALGYDGSCTYSRSTTGLVPEADVRDRRRSDARQVETISAARRLIFEGLLEAVSRGAEAAAGGVLVDAHFELLVPATEGELTRAGRDPDRYDARQRPELMRLASEAMQAAGVEVDVLGTWIVTPPSAG